MPTSYRGYMFDILWKIDNIAVATKSVISYTYLKTGGTLLRKDWDPPRLRRLGFKVICEMRARLFNGAPPTEYSNSQEFFAGVTVNQPVISVQSGRSANILVKSTVPVACAIINGVKQCIVRMELFSFEHQFNAQEQGHCNQSLTQKPKPSTCGLEFDGTRWNQWQTISVSALADQSSRPSYNALVKLRAISGRDTLWAQYALPDVNVIVTSQARPSGYCSSATDPYIRTVDGWGFTSTATGEFVLYRLRNKPVEVHTLQDSKGTNCAIAVRAATDIFIVYGCVSNKWIVRRLNCNAKDQHLQVFERSLGRIFEVFTPTGTRVYLTIQKSSWLNIQVYPSPNDWQQTEGLCGTYNGNWADDLSDRNGIVVSTNNHIRSWGVVQSESLFIARIRNDIIKTEFLYCSCTPDLLPPPNNLTQKADCSWEESLPLCPPLNWGTKECLIKGKRAAEDDLEIDVPENMVAFEESNLTDDWKNGWNESAARGACETTLKSSPMYENCKSLEGVDIENNIESCIRDIKISGTTLFLDNVKEKMKTECVAEVRFNSSLWNNSTTSGESLVDSVLDNDCPNDCSSAGVCTKGLCVCNASRTGEDCSVDLLSAPTLFKATEESLCDLSKRPCISISVFGEGFYSSGRVTCKLTKGYFSGSTVIANGSHVTENGNLESFSEVVCPVTIVSRKKRSVDTVPDPEAILVSVSMDGTRFSSSIPVVMYNSRCTTCTITDGAITCDTRTDICIVNGTCYPLADLKCGSSVVVSQPNQDLNVPMVIGVSVAATVIFAVIFAVGIKYYYHKRYVVKDVNNFQFSSNASTEMGVAPRAHNM